MASRASVTRQLAAGGFIAAAEEAEELTAAAHGDDARLQAMLERRLTGEPLAWLTGSVTFCGLRLHVDPGVYVPREHTALLAARAVDHLPHDGTAVDVCTGSGAVAAVLAARRPGARVVGTDVDGAAVACARRNGVEAYEGELLAPLPADLGPADVVCGVLPYVPTGELGLLQRDTLTFESPLAYDGGADGLDLVRKLIDDAHAALRGGGWLVLELGGDQATRLTPALHGFGPPEILRDEDGDVRGIACRRRP